MNTSLFITFEGGEGCGKSTQAKLLHRRLSELAIPALLTHEPGVTPLGKKITRLLKWNPDIEISPVAELLLFNASRAQLVTEVIRPGLENGTLVICDRFADSTTAYQGYGRRIDLDIVAAINSSGTTGLVPDLTILLDMPVEAGLTRKMNEKQDRFHMESVNFHRRVREGFLSLSEAEPGRWLVVDAAQGRNTIEGIVWERVSKLLAGRG